MAKLGVSILSADFGRLAEEIAAVEPEADLLHLDVMDGHFVPAISFGADVVRAIRKRTRLFLDVHLMVQNPDRHLGPFVEAGADGLTVHVEVCPHLHRTLQQIREAGAKAGVALNPSTPFGHVEQVLGDCGLILLMSVNPGFGGQRFIPFVEAKIAAARGRLQALGASCELEVDGGIKPENCQAVAAAGASILVIGSAVFTSPDRTATLREIRRRLRGEP
ncbi:MAG TPA: ribulose-phosphate 3-epimerase [Candidatus Methylomirabilis sp.]|jgi:ribulose-phosphate 3-epimerase|nr:ribulose-phosphate 3-epimerase [Candidatus Methylomirabilis sp.]